MSDTSSTVPPTMRQVVLRRRPTGLVTWDDLEIVDAPVPEIAEGQALMRVGLVGVDAAMRSWLNEAEGYFPPVEIGEVVRAAGVATIVATRSAAYAVGDVITHLCGLAEYAVATEGDGLSTTYPDGTDLGAVMSLYGSTGITAYVGTVDIGKVRAGETFVVSAAAGATGSVAGQIAKNLGARVVGIAGTDEKCRFVVDELGFDACVNHRGDLAAQLKEHCPKGVDVYFDNVGMPVLDAVLGRIAHYGRVVLCGAIAVYNETTKPPGPSNYLKLIQRRGRMEGFNAFDHWGRFDEIMAALRGWEQEGRLRHVEQVYDGLGSSVDALNALFTGANTGKVVIRP